MNNKCKVDVIVGLQHGDEGKGKIINELASDYDVLVRYQGGANSGHTVWKEDGSKVVFNVIPSGMLNTDVIGVITQGVVINPMAFTQEVDRVGLDIKDIRERLYISTDAHITLPSHILIDIYSEQFRSKGGSKIIGSTNRGNTPTYSDKVARKGIRVSDLARPDFMAMYNKATNEHFKYINNMFDVNGADILNTQINGIPFDEYEKIWHESVTKMHEFNYCNTVILLHEMCSSGKRILLEGAQGLMLDIDYGTYPYVTSSMVTSSAAFALTGIPSSMVGKVFGVFKPYVTRVGQGFFPTLIKEDNAIDNPVAEHIVEVGKEFGSVTGRKRMIGYLDLPQLKYACMINGVTDLIMMKCDVLSGTRFAVCGKYEYMGERSELYSDVYEGQDGFVDAIMQSFQPLGDLGSGVTDELSDLVLHINDFVSDVITSPRITRVSMSATAKSVTV